MFVVLEQQCNWASVALLPPVFFTNFGMWSLYYILQPPAGQLLCHSCLNFLFTILLCWNKDPSNIHFVDVWTLSGICSCLKLVLSVNSCTILVQNQARGFWNCKCSAMYKPNLQAYYSGERLRKLYLLLHCTIFIVRYIQCWVELYEQWTLDIQWWGKTWTRNSDRWDRFLLIHGKQSRKVRATQKLLLQRFFWQWRIWDW